MVPAVPSHRRSRRQTAGLRHRRPGPFHVQDDAKENCEAASLNPIHRLPPLRKRTARTECHSAAFKLSSILVLRPDSNTAVVLDVLMDCRYPEFQSLKSCRWIPSVLGSIAMQNRFLLIRRFHCQASEAKREGYVEKV